MAVKHSIDVYLPANYQVVMDVLRRPQFATLIEAKFTEAVKPAGTVNCIEFRYVTRMTLLDHARNFFITVPQSDGNTTKVTITTQSRKVTVLVDSPWRSKVERVSQVLQALIPGKK